MRQIEAGEPLQIIRGDVAIAEIQPVSHCANRPRPYGLAAGEFTVPDDFDEPLPEDIVKLFEDA